MSDGYRSSKVWLGIHKTEGKPGNLMYVLIDDRAAFDFIDLPEGGNASVRHKAIDEGTQYIIFQFWIKEFQKLDNAFGLMAYQFKKVAAARLPSSPVQESRG
jgi:hypothetical protein